MKNIYFGESMYGGYYMEYLDEADNRKYLHFDKISELKRFAKENGIDLKKACRLDN